jgi:hypothetical protein
VERLCIQIIEAKGNALRWAVGSSTGIRSGTWRLWGNKKGDVYLSMRSLGGVLKCSFHRDGNCHTGYTSEYADTARVRFGDLKRHWMKWRLPEEPMARAMQIVVPKSELRAFEEDNDKQTHWIPAPATGCAVTVSIFISKINGEEPWPEFSKGASPLGVMRMPERLIWIVYQEHPVSPDLASYFEDCRAKVSNMEGVAAVPQRTDVRAVFHGYKEEHDQFIIELAWD